MTPALTSYTCGPVASILITGTAPTAAEPVALTFTPATPFTVYGDIAKDAINPVWLRGTDGP